MTLKTDMGLYPSRPARAGGECERPLHVCGTGQGAQESISHMSGSQVSIKHTLRSDPPTVASLSCFPSLWNRLPIPGLEKSMPKWYFDDVVRCVAALFDTALSAASLSSAALAQGAETLGLLFEVIGKRIRAQLAPALYNASGRVPILGITLGYGGSIIEHMRERCKTWSAVASSASTALLPPQRSWWPASSSTAASYSAPALLITVATR